jgi:pyruvate/2-oxoglutarate dehydrogenase complex dihydrolipoamide dehydrogenase (E3) component
VLDSATLSAHLERDFGTSPSARSSTSRQTGTCLSRCASGTCLLSKNIIHSAKVASFSAHADAFGIRTEAVTIDMPRVQRRKREMVEDLVRVHVARYEASGVDLILGEARFVAPKTVTVALRDGGTSTLVGDRVILVLELFRHENIDVLLNAPVRHVEGCSGEHVRLCVDMPGHAHVIEATDVLVAAGRTANTNDIGVELAGIELDARGYIVVNDRLETTARGVWAVGDCAGSPQFTHVAFDDFRVVNDTLN